MRPEAGEAVAGEGGGRGKGAGAGGGAVSSAPGVACLCEPQPQEAHPTPRRPLSYPGNVQIMNSVEFDAKEIV